MRPPWLEFKKLFGFQGSEQSKSGSSIITSDVPVTGMLVCLPGYAVRKSAMCRQRAL